VLHGVLQQGVLACGMNPDEAAAVHECKPTRSVMNRRLLLF
jgi:hypothetical protein